MKAIIIAGGFGTRLRPLTYNTPKSIVPVANRPLLLHQVELLAKYGIKEIILNLHYLSQSIKTVIEDIKKTGVKIEYSIEETPLGTAGAVKAAEEFFSEGPMLVFNGDILTDMNLSELIKFHEKKKARATLTLVRVEDPTTYGLVITDLEGRVERFIEKPSWEAVTTNTINAGIYVIDPKIFRDVAPGVEYSFERELFPKLLEAHEPIYGHELKAYWIDIGNPTKYKKVHHAILDEEVRVKILGRRMPKDVWIDDRVEIEESTKILGPVLIGKGCRIGKDSRINHHTVIGDRVEIGDNSIIEDSIIWEGVRVGDEAHLENCIIGFNCVIGDNADLSNVVLADWSVLKKGSKIGRSHD